jgi:riboflavin kinase / FMN adenylyltransferase
MQIVRSLDAYHADAGLLLTIGVFDGVHVGHRAVLERLRANRSPGVLAGALTFEHHPHAFLHPGHAPKALTTVAEKINLLDECGLDVLFLLPFDERIQVLSGSTFLTDVLLAKLRTRMLIVGGNWRFGKDRDGDVALAQRVLERSGCAFAVEELLTEQGERVSSSRIRGLIEERRFEQADALLGSPFTVRGVVQGGEGRGHLLGFPTANLDVSPEKLIPTPGVYGSIARHDGADHRAVVSIGDKPTFGGHEVAVEAYILDFDRSVYGEQLAIRSFEFVREQRRFENAAALVEQMKRDVAHVRKAAR